MMKHLTPRSLPTIATCLLAWHTHAQTGERLLVHSVQAENLTYVSVAKDGDGNLYSATSYEADYTYEGNSITMLNPGSTAEVLYCKHSPEGDLLFSKRIAVTGGNTPSVGRVEFMAVDGAGYGYLSTQGTTGAGFLQVEDDSLALLTGAGNMIIQLHPNGSLRAVRRFLGTRNVAAADSLFYMALTDQSDGNKAKLQCFDSTFTTPLWTVEGTSSLVIGPISFDRTQLAVSPDGNLVALLAKEGSGAATFGGLNVPFATSNGFDEFAILICDRDGGVQGIRTYFGSPTTGGQNELPNAVAIGNDGSVTASSYGPGTVQFAGSSFAQLSGFSSNHGMIVHWDADGNEAWATQLLSQTQSPRIDGLAVHPNGDIIVGATWAGNFQLGSASGTGVGLRSLTARLNGNDGSVQWTYTPSAVTNSVNGQRIVVLSDVRYAMSGRGVEGYTYAGLPAVNGNRSQFLLIVQDPTVGLEELEAHGGLSIAQDLANDLVYVDLVEGEAPYQLMDAQGRVVRTGQLVQGRNQLTTRAFVDGVYILRCDTKVGPRSVRFVKY